MTDAERKARQRQQAGVTKPAVTKPVPPKVTRPVTKPGVTKPLHEMSEVERLRAHLSANQRELADGNREQAKLRKQIAELKAERRKLDPRSLQRLEAERQRLTTANAAFAEGNPALAKLTAANASLIAQVNALQADRRPLMDKLREAEKRASQLNARIRELMGGDLASFMGFGLNRLIAERLAEGDTRIISKRVYRQLQAAVHPDRVTDGDAEKRGLYQEALAALNALKTRLVIPDKPPPAPPPPPPVYGRPEDYLRTEPMSHEEAAAARAKGAAQFAKRQAAARKGQETKAAKRQDPSGA